jgi:hypothetical protein
MPWLPELFSAPVVERIQRRAADERAAQPVPFFEGIQSDETDALTGSFAGEPELHQGTVLTLDAPRGRIELPVAVAADRDDDARIIELRVYYDTWPFTGRHASRPPVLQSDPAVLEPDILAEYQRALAAGDVQATLATFEPDASVREPAGGEHVHHGHDQLVALYERFFSAGGGVEQEPCAVTDDGHSCALEYNVVRWGATELLPPEAGLAVYVRGTSGKLAKVRIYDDADPPGSAER